MAGKQEAKRVRINKNIATPRIIKRGAKKEETIMEQANKLYVGNLSYETTEDELKNFFNEKGIETKSVTLITDKYTGRSKGFGFVEVENDEILQKAVQELHEQELDGRRLTINKANPPKERSDRGGYGGGNRSGGSGGGRSGGFGDRKRPRY